ncbi:hypothetical protein EJD97_021247, partial [Solanum chilense]
MLEICQKAAGSTDLATGRRGYNGLSWTPLSHTLQILLLLFITLDGRYDGLFQARRSVEGLRSITLKLLEFRYWDYFPDNHDELVGWTFMATMVRHALRNPTLGHTSPFSFNSFTTMPPTDRHRLDEPSQAPY